MDLRPQVRSAGSSEIPEHRGGYAVRLRRRARAIGPTPRFAVAGFLAACLAVVAGGQAGTVDTTTPVTTWLGLLSPTGYRPGHSWVAALLLFVGIGALVFLWLAALRRLASAAFTERQVWCVAATWSAPFLFGPPLISKDVFSYAA
jgi:alpha-1,6-mannosyltransferase